MASNFGCDITLRQNAEVLTKNMKQMALKSNNSLKSKSNSIPVIDISSDEETKDNNKSSRPKVNNLKRSVINPSVKVLANKSSMNVPMRSYPLSVRRNYDIVRVVEWSSDEENSHNFQVNVSPLKDDDIENKLKSNDSSNSETPNKRSLKVKVSLTDKKRVVEWENKSYSKDEETGEYFHNPNQTTEILRRDPNESILEENYKTNQTISFQTSPEVEPSVRPKQRIPVKVENKTESLFSDTAEDSTEEPIIYEYNTSECFDFNDEEDERLPHVLAKKLCDLDMKTARKWRFSFYSVNKKNEHLFDPFLKREEINKLNKLSKSVQSSGEPQTLDSRSSSKDTQTTKELPNYRIEFLVFDMDHKKRVLTLIKEWIGFEECVVYVLTECVLNKHTFISISGSLNNMEKIKSMLKISVSLKEIKIKGLPQSYCSICFSSDHTRVDSKQCCGFCRGQDHLSRDCHDMKLRTHSNAIHPKFLPAIKKLYPLKYSTRQIRNYIRKRGYLTKATQDVSFYVWDHKKFPNEHKEWTFAAMYVQKGFTKSGRPTALHVVITHHPVGKKTCEVLLCAYIKDPELNDCALPHSGIMFTDVRNNGISIKTFKKHFKAILEKKTLFLWNGFNDLYSLGIIQYDCESIGLNLVDLSLVPLLRDPLNHNKCVSLQKAYWSYKKKLIKEVDPKIRQWNGGNTEMTARAILKVGEEVLQALDYFVKWDQRGPPLKDYTQIVEDWMSGIRDGKVMIQSDKIRGLSLAELKKLEQKWDNYLKIALKDNYSEDLVPFFLNHLDIYY